MVHHWDIEISTFTSIRQAAPKDFVTYLMGTADVGPIGAFI